MFFVPIFRHYRKDVFIMCTMFGQRLEAYNVNNFKSLGDNFLQFPIDFIENPLYASLSSNAKILYTRLKGFLHVSLKYGLVDSYGTLYCYASTLEAQRICNIASFSKSTASRVFQELESFGLILRKGPKVYVFPTVGIKNEISKKNIDVDIHTPVDNLVDKSTETVNDLPNTGSDSMCERKDCKFETGENSSLAKKNDDVSDLKLQNPESGNNIYVNINSIATTNKDQYTYNKLPDVANTFSESNSADEDEKSKQLYQKLCDIGIIARKCRELIAEYDHGLLQRALTSLYAKMSSNNSSVRNPAGYFLYMLKNKIYMLHDKISSTSSHVCGFDSNQAKAEVHESQESVLKNLGFSGIISKIMVNAVQKFEAFSFTEKKACSELGFDPAMIYESIRTNDFNNLPALA